MKFKISIIVKKNPKVTIDFQFGDLYSMRDFIAEWIKHSIEKKLELCLEGFDC